MALVLADRVNETTTTAGTGTVTLAGAVSGYQSFSAIGNGNTTYYTIAHQSANEWEVGIGTYTSSGTTLSRDTVLASSNSGSLVNFSAGTKNVFADYPAGKAVYQNASGNVGIGTAGPTAKLDVSVGSGTTYAIRATSADNFTNARFTARPYNGSSGVFDFRKQSDDSVLSQIYVTNGATPDLNILNAQGYAITFGTNNAERMRLDSSANLLIGTTTDVFGSSGNLVVAGGNISLYANDPTYGIRLNGTTTTVDSPGYSSLTSVNATSVEARNGYVYFLTGSGSGTSERMRIDSSGNVGIGTSSPVAPVHAVRNYTNTSDMTFVAQGNIPGLNLRSTAGGRLSILGNYAAADSSSIVVGTGTNNPTTEIMRVDHTTSNISFNLYGGNVGIGVTPSAWSSSYPAFQIKNAALWSGTGLPTFVSLTANAYDDGAYRYISTAAASEYYQYLGQHVWRTAVSGTAGNPISFTQAMTLDASGNLGIGTTAPLKLSTGNAISIGSKSLVAGDIYASYLGFNLYYNSGWKVATTSSVNGALLTVNEYGRLQFFDASSGNAGDASTLRQIFYIDPYSQPSATFGYTTGALSDFAVNISSTNVYPALNFQQNGTTFAGLLGYAGVGLYYDSTGIHVFRTGGSERARIDSSGNLLVGTTTSPSGSGNMVVAGAVVNTRINPRVSSTTSTASITPDVSAYDQYCVTAQAATLTINAPTGTPVDGQKLMFRILDNGTSQTLSWNATFTAIGVTIPTATTASKMTYVGAVYNAANTRWDVIAVTTQA